MHHILLSEFGSIADDPVRFGAGLWNGGYTFFPFFPGLRDSSLDLFHINIGLMMKLGVFWFTRFTPSII
jgi:hypothetical protein